MLPQRSKGRDNEVEGNSKNQNVDASLEKHKKMELPQAFSSSSEAFDAVFFSGANHQGYYLIIATERRPNNVTYGILYVLVSLGFFGRTYTFFKSLNYWFKYILRLLQRTFH